MHPLSVQFVQSLNSGSALLFISSPENPGWGVTTIERCFRGCSCWDPRSLLRQQRRPDPEWYVIVRSSSAWLLLIPQLTLCFLFHFPFPSEVMRVLKPGGFYVFVEHVAAKGAYLLRLLHRMNTILSFMNDDWFVLFCFRRKLPEVCAACCWPTAAAGRWWLPPHQGHCEEHTCGGVFRCWA